MPVDMADSNVMVESAGGTSVLVLDNVGTVQEGFYHCEALLVNGSTLVSSTATLEINGECGRLISLASWVYL